MKNKQTIEDFLEFKYPYFNKKRSKIKGTNDYNLIKIIKNYTKQKVKDALEKRPPRVVYYNDRDIL